MNMERVFNTHANARWVLLDIAIIKLGCGVKKKSSGKIESPPKNKGKKRRNKVIGIIQYKRRKMNV